MGLRNHVFAATLLLLATFSSLFCLGLSYFWIRSYFIAEVLYLKPTPAPPNRTTPLPGKPNLWQYQYQFVSSAGRLQMVRRNLAVGDESPAVLRHLRPSDPSAFIQLSPTDAGDAAVRFAGIDYFSRERHYISSGGMQFWAWGFLIITIPYWMAVLLTALLPGFVVLIYLRQRRRRRRLGAGLCLHCGYDLRGSENICPECGKIFATSSAVARR